jgi:hypothetical protein
METRVSQVPWILSKKLNFTPWRSFSLGSVTLAGLNVHVKNNLPQELVLTMQERVKLNKPNLPTRFADLQQQHPQLKYIWYELWQTTGLSDNSYFGGGMLMGQRIEVDVSRWQPLTKVDQKTQLLLLEALQWRHPISLNNSQPEIQKSNATAACATPSGTTIAANTVTGSHQLQDQSPNNFQFSPTPSPQYNHHPSHSNEPQMQVGKAIWVLRQDLPDFFETGLTDMSIYAPNVTFSEPFHLRLAIRGKRFYGFVAKLIKWFGRAWYENADLEVVRMMQTKGPLHGAHLDDVYEGEHLGGGPGSSGSGGVGNGLSPGKKAWRSKAVHGSDDSQRLVVRWIFQGMLNVIILHVLSWNMHFGCS